MKSALSSCNFQCLTKACIHSDGIVEFSAPGSGGLKEICN